MITNTPYVERETGIKVLVSTAWEWGTDDALAVIQYPNEAPALELQGRRYVIPVTRLGDYFDLVTPAEISIQSFGTNTDRPTAAQRMAVHGNSNT